MVDSNRFNSRLSVTSQSGGGDASPMRIPVSTVLAGASLAGNVSSSASSSSRSTSESSTLHRLHERHVDHVLGHEPDLQFVAPNHVADQQVVRSIVAGFGREPSHRARLFEN